MNSLMKVLALGLIMIVSMTALNAQKGSKLSVEEKANKETTAVVDALQLDEATAAKLSAINTTYAKKLKTLNADFKAKKKAGEPVDKAVRKAAQKEMNKAKNKEVKAMLGKEQGKAYNKFMKKYKKMNKKMKPKKN